MLVRRKDHACALVQIDNERGILVSGGVDNEDNLLDSVEFYNLATQAWEEISALKNARTEHGKTFWSFVMMAMTRHGSTPGCRAAPHHHPFKTIQGVSTSLG